MISQKLRLALCLGSHLATLSPAQPGETLHSSGPALGKALASGSWSGWLGQLMSLKFITFL